MCNFTKGPWIARGSTPSRVYGMARTDKEVLVAACGGVIEQAGANAHLIAAAPEMYEMLEKVLVEYKEMLGMSQEVKDIEKLLSKSRGEHV